LAAAGLAAAVRAFGGGSGIPIPLPLTVAHNSKPVRAEGIGNTTTARGMEPPPRRVTASAATLRALLAGSGGDGASRLPTTDPLVVGAAAAVAQRGPPPSPAPTEAEEEASTTAAAGGRYRSVAVRDAATLSYDDFVSQFMGPGVPVLLRGVADRWPAARLWAAPGGGVDVAALERAAAGGGHVAATDSARRLGGCGETREVPLGAYARWWRARGTSASAVADGGGGGGGELECAPGAVWYLKDWHLAAERAARRVPPFYTPPPFFADDWLNGFFDAQAAAAASGDAGGAAAEAAGAAAAAAAAEAEEAGTAIAAGGSAATTADYRFVYLGPAGSFTPLHADVLRSFSWSANVAGRKRWLLLPPRATHLLYDAPCTRLAPDFWAAGIDGLDPRDFPWLPAARAQLFEVIQEAGEALFVPSGWHHTVRNLEDTLSINHNWLNAFNIRWAAALLATQHADAAAGIADCRPLCDSAAEFEALVQRNVSANAGLGFDRFLALLACAARPHLAAAGRGGAHELGCSAAAAEDDDDAAAHREFDLRAVRAALDALLLCCGGEGLQGVGHVRAARALAEEIDSALDAG